VHPSRIIFLKKEIKSVFLESVFGENPAKDRCPCKSAL